MKLYTEQQMLEGLQAYYRWMMETKPAIQNFEEWFKDYLSKIESTTTSEVLEPKIKIQKSGIQITQIHLQHS